MEKPLKLIITGGPGTGKSSVLEILRSRGIRCENEIARQVIHEQMLLQSDLVPWLNLLEYSKLVFEKIARVAKNADQYPLTVFDRSTIDVIAYLRHGGIDVPDYMKAQTDRLGYHRLVFFTPFWPEIYLNDTERKETGEIAEEISRFLKETYEFCGFEVLELPKVSAPERSIIISNYIENLKQ